LVPLHKYNIEEPKTDCMSEGARRDALEAGEIVADRGSRHTLLRRRGFPNGDQLFGDGGRGGLKKDLFKNIVPESISIDKRST
jgi:hypothetical protein